MEENEYVPFVSEVETFNETMGKPNNYIHRCITPTLYSRWSINDSE